MLVFNVGCLYEFSPYNSYEHVYASDLGKLKLAEIDRLVPGNLYRPFATNLIDGYHDGLIRRHTYKQAAILSGRDFEIIVFGCRNKYSVVSKIRDGFLCKRFNSYLYTFDDFNTIPSEIHAENDVVMFLGYIPYGFKVLWKTKVGFIPAHQSIFFAEVE